MEIEFPRFGRSIQRLPRVCVTVLLCLCMEKKGPEGTFAHGSNPLLTLFRTLGPHLPSDSSINLPPPPHTHNAPASQSASPLSSSCLVFSPAHGKKETVRQREKEDGFDRQERGLVLEQENRSLRDREWEEEREDVLSCVPCNPLEEKKRIVE